MGFTTWPYAATLKAVNDTYEFIGANGDLITEHIEEGVPWTAVISGKPFPQSFVAKLDGRRRNRPKGMKLLLSLTALNMGRSGLADDVGEIGKQPIPATAVGFEFKDSSVHRAYLAYCEWMIDFFKPDYLLTGIESNELLNNSPGKWTDYVAFSREIQFQLKKRHPNLPISESVTLHKLLDTKNPSIVAYRKSIHEFVAKQDFFAVSFYPFFLGLHTRSEFTQALQFLSNFCDKPIGIAETGHPAIPIVVKSYGLNFRSSPEEQDQYVQALISEAQTHRYLFVTYWLTRDFYELWKTFPVSSKDLAGLWRDTGLVDKDGVKRPAFATWKAAADRPIQ